MYGYIEMLTRCAHKEHSIYDSNPREGRPSAKGGTRQFVLRRDSRRNPIFYLLHRLFLITFC